MGIFELQDECMRHQPFFNWEAAGFWSTAQLLCFSWAENFRNGTLCPPRSEEFYPEGKEWGEPRIRCQESRGRACREAARVQGAQLGAPQWQRCFWGPCIVGPAEWDLPADSREKLTPLSILRLFSCSGLLHPGEKPGVLRLHMCGG